MYIEKYNIKILIPDVPHPSQSYLVFLKSSPLFLIAKQYRQVPYVLIKASGRPRSTGRLFCH